jgi:hypothetical protein
MGQEKRGRPGPRGFFSKLRAPEPWSHNILLLLRNNGRRAIAPLERQRRMKFQESVSLLWKATDKVSSRLLMIAISGNLS